MHASFQETCILCGSHAHNGTAHAALLCSSTWWEPQRPIAWACTSRAICSRGWLCSNSGGSAGHGRHLGSQLVHVRPPNRQLQVTWGPVLKTTSVPLTSFQPSKSIFGPRPPPWVSMRVRVAKQKYEVGASFAQAVQAKQGGPSFGSCAIHLGARP